MRNELLTATRGQGAPLTGYPPHCCTARDLDRTTHANGSPFKSKQEATPSITIIRKPSTRVPDATHNGVAAR